MFDVNKAVSNNMPPNISRWTWALSVEIGPHPARLPLTVAWQAQEVPAWDWTRGVDPWASLAGFVEESPLPELTYPRFVRRESLYIPPPQLPKLPLYPYLARLGREARKHHHTSPAFIQKALQVAQTVGLLDPYGRGDSLADWHFFASEVYALISFLRRWREGSEDLESLTGGLRVEEGWTQISGGWRYVGPEDKRLPSLAIHAVADLFEKTSESGRPRLQRIASLLMERVWSEIVSRIRWDFIAKSLEAGKSFPALSYVGSRYWVIYEVATLYFQASTVRFCVNPNCRVAFLPKKRDQETCGRPACVVWLSRKRRREGFGPKRQGWGDKNRKTSD